MTRFARRFAACLALAGLVFAALAPLASQARTKTLRIPILICGSGGTQEIHLDVRVPGAPGAMEHRDHCALCIVGIEPLAQRAPAAPIFVPLRDLSTGPDADSRALPSRPSPRPPSQAPPAAA